jgi:DNA polymerase-3 subunit epsilon
VTGRARLAVAMAALCVALLAGLALLGAGVWATAPPVDRAALIRIAGSQVIFLASGCLVLLILLAWMVAKLFGRHVLTPRRLAADARLIATVNAGHRLTLRHPAEFAELASAVNELAERYEAAERDVTARVEAGRADVAQERNRLAALMSELTAAVLVCTADGRIVLYNAAARRLLEERPDSPAIVGLGRSAFSIVDRDLVAHVLDRTRTGAVAHATTTWGERVLRVDVAPVATASEAGFVVLVEDVTRRVETTRRRDALLRELTEGVRSATGAIRGAVENLLDYPDMPATDRERFVGIVRDEAVALGDRVDLLMRRSAEHLTDRSVHADMSATDLLTAVADTVAAGPGPRIALEAPGEPIWLRLDGYSAVRAVAALLARLHTEHGVDDVAVWLHRDGRHAALSAGWHGVPVSAETIRAWSAEPAGGPGEDTIADILARHEAQVWSRADADGRAHLRLLLPLAEERAETALGPLRPDGSDGPGGAGAAVGPRKDMRDVGVGSQEPDFYDFDLFQVTGAEVAWEHRPLDEIAYTVFDTETTGLQPADGDEIIAIGAVRIVNGRLLRQETFDRLVNPCRPVPAASRRIHGITADMLQGQPTIDEVLPAFARFAEDTVLVGHNVSFDLAFLRHKQMQTGVVFTQPVFDTLLLSAAVHPDHEEHTMEAIADRLGVEVVGRHSAVGDALLTGEIFVRLVRLLERQGIHTVGEAREAARRTFHARIDERRYGRGRMPLQSSRANRGHFDSWARR